MEGSLLQNILLRGEELSSALVSGDLENYFELLDQRGRLVDRLQEFQHPSEIDSDWRGVSEALRKQHQVLTYAFTERERQMQEELTELERFKEAARTYQIVEPRTQILNRDLRV